MLSERIRDGKPNEVSKLSLTIGSTYNATEAGKVQAIHDKVNEVIDRLRKLGINV